MTGPVKWGPTIPMSADALRGALGWSIADMQLHGRSSAVAELARQEARQRVREEHIAALAAHTALTSKVNDPIAAAVLQLHQPVWEDHEGTVCRGCPADAEYGAEPWSCATWDLIAETAAAGHAHRWVEIHQLSKRDVELQCTLPGCGASKTETR